MAIISLKNEDVIWIDHEKTGVLLKNSWGALYPEFKAVAVLNPKFKGLEKEHTYLMVYNNSSTYKLSHDFFLEKFKDNIIFEAPMSTNSNHPGTGPRNTLYVLEVKNE